MQMIIIINKVEKLLIYTQKDTKKFTICTHFELDMLT